MIGDPRILCCCCCCCWWDCDCCSRLDLRASKLALGGEAADKGRWALDDAGEDTTLTLGERARLRACEGSGGGGRGADADGAEVESPEPVEGRWLVDAAARLRAAAGRVGPIVLDARRESGGFLSTTSIFTTTTILHSVVHSHILRIQQFTITSYATRVRP